MKKRIVCMMGIIMTGLMSGSVFAEPTISFGSVQIENGNAIERDNLLYMPIRTVSEALGYEVLWESTQKSVTVTDNETVEIKFIANNDICVINQENVQLSGKVFIENSMAFVPVEVLDGIMGYTVELNDDVINIVTQAETEATDGKINAEGFVGTATEITEEEILFLENTGREVRLAKSNETEVTDTAGNIVNIKDIKSGDKLVVNYSEVMTNSLPPLNNPISITIVK